MPGSSMSIEEAVCSASEEGAAWEESRRRKKKEKVKRGEG